jgi:hypothetical protein
MMDEYTTEIYFPAGQSDLRYYINAIPKTSPVAKPEDQLVLICESRASNGLISLDWEVRLHPFTLPPFDLGVLDGHIGTLRAMLARRGLSVDIAASPAAKAKLDQIQPLAGYWMINQVNSSLHYWFISEHGATSRVRSVEIDALNLGMLPALRRPYPVSPEEAAFIKHQAGRSNKIKPKAPYRIG